MHNIKVDKAALLEVLHKNRAGHRDTYLKAFEGYRQECIAILEQNLADLKARTGKHIVFMEPPPVDNTPEYDTIIGMLEMSVDTVIELDTDQYRQYVKDDWQWKRAWLHATSKYLAQ